MKYKSPIVSAVVLLACCSAIIALAQSFQQAKPPQNEANEAPNGQDLIKMAARKILQQPALEAKIRQRIDLFGHELVGSGKYMQLGSQEQKLLRLELKLHAANQVTSVQQICDGRSLWIRSDLPPKKTLSRIDVRKIREAIKRSSPERIGSISTAMATGGLAELLEGLDRNFDFGPARADKIGSFPVWVIEGRWKQAQLAKLLPNQEEAILAGKRPQLEKLAVHLPDSVMLVLGRDNKIPLFPYRLEYRRTAVPVEVTEQLEISKYPRILVAMELFEVSLPTNLDPRMFAYKLSEQELVDQKDITDQYLQRMGLTKKEAVNSQTAENAEEKKRF